MKDQLEKYQLSIKILEHREKLIIYLYGNIDLLKQKQTYPDHEDVINHYISEYENNIISLTKRIRKWDKILYLYACEIKESITIFEKSDKDIDHIIKTVSEYFNFPIKIKGQIYTIHSKTRKRPILKARQIAQYFARQKTKKTFEYIGNHIGGNDRTNVMHSCKTVKNQMDTDRKYKKIITEINEILWITKTK